MNKSDLRKLIKPLVKECVKETLIEEGILSGIVKEVVQGVVSASPIVEQPKRTKRKPRKTFEENINHERAKESKRKINEHQKKLLDAIGTDSYNGVDLFEGTTPMSGQNTTKPGANDLGEPSDPGVPFSGPLAEASKMWGKLL
jgi:hypothetical protein|tara:strand:+ start:11306 stop:11734 length:429 start_codon:yes stop_codon:yes gene_type:complete